jgi:hypothetical protein
MWTLSGFADEISPDLEEECELLDTLGIRFIELRSAWDTNVLDLDDDQVGRVHTALRRMRSRPHRSSSPFGEISVRDEVRAAPGTVPAGVVGRPGSMAAALHLDMAQHNLGLQEYMRPSRAAHRRHRARLVRC